VLEWGRVPPARTDPLVIFDDVLIHRHAAGRPGDELSHVEFCDRRDDILRAQETLEMILDLAHLADESQAALVLDRLERLERLVRSLDRRAQSS